MKTYDPTQVQINIGTLTLTGVADGTFVKISRNTAERYKKKVGAKGEVSRSRVTDKSGTVEVTLKHTSPSNYKLYFLDKLPKTFPVSIIETGSSKFVASATEAWIEKIPQPEFGVEESNAVWVFGCSDLDYGQID